MPSPDARRIWFSPLCLLVGAAVIAVSGVRHPMLAGDGASQLAVIAATPGWRSIHWGLLFGFALVIIGLAWLASRYRNTVGEGAARAGICLATFGYAVFAVGVLFMTGAGPTLADAMRRADLGLTATHAVFLYDMLHPFAQSALRTGAFAIALATGAYGWAVLSDTAQPPMLGYFGVVAGAAGAMAAIALPETSYQVVLGAALATVWQLVVAIVALLPARGAPATA